MPRYSDNLGLRLPLGKEYFNINTWNTNMRLLDEAYALLRDSSGTTHAIPADMVRFDNTGTNILATNVQAAIEEIAKETVETNTFFIDVTEDITITVATYDHAYFVLAFGNTVPEVTFVPSIQEQDFVWLDGEPSFQPNSVYELSFLHLCCKWFKR